MISGNSVLVIGARGMLASDVIPLLKERDNRLSLCDLIGGDLDGLPVQTCDLADRVSVARVLDLEKPKIIMNLAAFTAVDAAEKDYSKAFAVNGMGPAILANWANLNSAMVVHISTDYVFGGDAELARLRAPIPETHPTQPCGIYGESKRMGEEMVRAIAPESSLILRTSWLHGLGGPNFVDTIRKVLHERLKSGENTPLRVVDDQIGSPTYSKWLAEVMLELVDRNARGTFHTCSRGDISWFEFAKEIAAIEAPSVPVHPQTSSELSRPAPRPPYSTLDVSKLEKFLGKECPSWKDGLRAHLDLRRSRSNG